LLERANGLAHLPPDLAKRLTLKIPFSTKWSPHPRTEGGHVEPVLGAFLLDFQASLRQIASQAFFEREH
jgi:hypothetical protein